MLPPRLSHNRKQQQSSSSSSSLQVAKQFVVTRGLSFNSYITQKTKIQMEVALVAEQKAKFAEQEAGDWLCNRPTAKGAGLHVADSYTSNHPEDDFTPLETIRRLCSVFGRRSHLGFEGETSEPKGK
ncbi:hypothetical protein Tco_0246988, partial [Tanacetum coccineum]